MTCYGFSPIATWLMGRNPDKHVFGKIWQMNTKVKSFIIEKVIGVLTRDLTNEQKVKIFIIDKVKEGYSEVITGLITILPSLICKSSLSITTKKCFKKRQHR